jgi:hypothetical protein
MIVNSYNVWKTENLQPDESPSFPPLINAFFIVARLLDIIVIFFAGSLYYQSAVFFL